MNKDALIATLIGLSIGLLLTGIILLGPGLAKSIPAITIPKLSSISLPDFLQKKPKLTPTPEQTAKNDTHAITIDSPLEEAIEQDDVVLVSGTTSKGATVVLQGFVDDVVIDANGDGKYAGKITLVEGKNIIIVTSYNEKNEPVTQQRVLYYTPEEW